jgi:phosphoribosylglycinamide formyltransferase 1
MSVSADRQPPLRIEATVLGSSGGAAWAAAMHCWREAGHQARCLVLTDRPCGLAEWGKEHEQPVIELPYREARDFSARALTVAREQGSLDVLLFYTRRVASPLIDEARVCNIHPSLLPHFPGLHAVEQALAAQAEVLGASLHVVDQGLDTGPLLAQVQSPLTPGLSLVQAHRMSFMHKVWLTLWWCERLALGPQSPGAPILRDEALSLAHQRWCQSLAPVA